MLRHQGGPPRRQGGTIKERMKMAVAYFKTSRDGQVRSWEDTTMSARSLDAWRAWRAVRLYSTYLATLIPLPVPRPGEPARYLHWAGFHLRFPEQDEDKRDLRFASHER